MKRHWLILLPAAAYLVSAGIVYGSSWALHRYLGWDESLTDMCTLLYLLFLCYLARRRVSMLLLVAGLFGSFRCMATALGNAPVERLCHFCSNTLMVVKVLSVIFVDDADDDEWWKKLQGKIKSTALTAVNAASFQRQAKEATT